MLHISIAAGLVLGLITGLLAAAGSDLFMVIALGSAPLGTAFMNAIRMVVIPLVMAVIFSGVANLGDLRRLGRLGGTTLGFFWATIPPAIVIGMGTMFVGLRFAPDVSAPAAAAREAPVLPSLVDFLVDLIPSNPFAAASAGALLPLIVFTALFAAAAGSLEEEPRQRLIGFAEAASEALIKLVWWILWTAPIGIFGLAAPVTAQLGWGLIQSLAVFVVSVVLALGIYVGVVYLPILKFVGGVGPMKFLGGTFGATSVAFSTTSTAAALPVTLDEVHRNLGVSETVTDLVVPLGASMYRAGSALFQGAAIIFLAHLYDTPIPAAALGGAVLATFLVSLTVAPVPSSGVVTLAPALDTLGVPLAGLSILLGIDRIPDMFRTSVNLMGQMTTAVVVDTWVGGEDPGTAVDASRDAPGQPQA
ncbi:MAG: dicarboxylate/amino acid:cation symporter [Gemmatimonadota bacterium]|nr:dicarboxylate/amino acid:cation symporter [Gemmatimonadota bacterium]MDE3005639.1 dicarboxylate/amino acid:cation symporter [Gemmatimonadota bacterium]MDE3013108.1 dicarboxylate/amino acid:cation symporter [Gemmatimonadota bacterium]